MKTTKEQAKTQIEHTEQVLHMSYRKESDLLFVDHLGTKHADKKVWQWFKLQMEEESREAELKGVGKILDSLWTASIPLLGEKASKRIKEEMVYYFGKNWAVVMYKFIGQKGNRHKPVKTLDQITLKNSKGGKQK